MEWDRHCRTVLDRHWPDIPKWGDVSETKGYELPPVDCIIFGSPCQDLSVAGKRAGLDGERSGLFHEAMRVIKEMRDATNGTFPRWIVWENVAGAFSSNKGADFGTVIDQMAEAGAVGIEWALLDAQHFGVPQRRRRVFVVACFDPATLKRCPDPLLPVSESLRGDSAKGRKKGKTITGEVGTSLASGNDIANTIPAELYHKSTVVNQDVNNGHLVVSKSILGSDIVRPLNTSDAKMISTQYVNENKCVVEPFVKSRRPQSATDDETWVEGEVAPTLNAFDVGDTRATTAIIEPMLLDGRRVDDIRIYEPPVQTLQARMGTGGNNVPVLAFDTQFGSNANVFEDHTPPMKASQASPSVAYSIREDAKANNFSATELDHANALSAVWPSPQSHHAQMFIAEAVAYDEYNDRLGGEIHHALRAGTKQSTGVMADMAVRRLTPIECERLMGWPDDHTRWTAEGKEQSDTHRYKQCGNGVASPVAQWIAEHMRRVDEIQ